MSGDLHALSLESGGQRLTFKCTYATLIRLEALGDWRALLADAASFRAPGALITIGAIFADVAESEFIALSPPIQDVQRCITGAWTLCFEGPEGLRAYQDAVAKEAAADEGKTPTPSASSLAAQLWTRITRLSPLGSPKTPSGA